MRKPTLYVTIGPAACGKSTFAHAMMVSDTRARNFDRKEKRYFFFAMTLVE